MSKPVHLLSMAHHSTRPELSSVARRSINRLAEQVGVTAVARVLLDQVNDDSPQRDLARVCSAEQAARRPCSSETPSSFRAHSHVVQSAPRNRMQESSVVSSFARRQAEQLASCWAEPPLRAARPVAQSPASQPSVSRRQALPIQPQRCRSTRSRLRLPTAP